MTKKTVNQCASNSKAGENAVCDVPGRTRICNRKKTCPVGHMFTADRILLN
jgi:hypothetical protein